MRGRLFLALSVFTKFISGRGEEMENLYQDKVIIVEGLSDRNKIKKIIKEPIEIICTNGTISADTIRGMGRNMV